MTQPRIFQILCGLALFASSVAAQSQPVIINNTFPPGNVGQSYSQALVATGGIAPYRWSVNGPLPTGLLLNSVGTIAGTPTVGGTFLFVLTVTDAQQASNSKQFSIVIAGGTSGSRLTVSTTSLPNGVVGASYSQTFAATGGTQPYRWAVGQGFPNFLTLDAVTGTISGTPAAPGTFSFPVQVSDSINATATVTLTLTVDPAPLTITTLPPIFSGTVGIAYVQTFRATGGAPPYTWSITSGSTGDLTLDPATGDLKGTPQTAGTLNFTITVADSASRRTSQPFSLSINAPVLTITLGAPLPPATVAVSYSQKLPVAANGGTPPYVWSLAAGSNLPSGLVIDFPSLTISGTPTAAGAYNFSVQVADAAGLTASRSLALTVSPAALGMTTARQLPDGTLNQPYSQIISAVGGQPPYRWSASGLPNGLTMNSVTGQISGTASAAGNFGLAVTVTDNVLTNFSDRFTLTIKLPPTPDATISGLPALVAPAQQYTLQVNLASPFPAPISGQAILSFSPDTGPADRTIQFATGGTTASFNIAAGSTTPDVPLALQTGTVSGTITISLRLQAGGIDITPTPAPVTTGQVPRAAPVIRGVQINRSGNTLNVVITGYSTARELTQAVFGFNAASGSTLQSTASSITIDTGSQFNTWFQDPNNSQFGSVFVYTQPFTVQGDVNAVLPSSVTLTNRVGNATFPIQ